MIATHWPVEDKAGYLFISETLKQIINNKVSITEAMQKTKVAFIRGKFGDEYKHPFYWSSYVLIEGNS